MNRSLETYRIAGWGGRVRYVTCRPEESMIHMRLIGFAWVTADLTTRPAYREMIDTLRWEDML